MNQKRFLVEVIYSPYTIKQHVGSYMFQKNTVLLINDKENYTTHKAKKDTMDSTTHYNRL